MPDNHHDLEIRLDACRRKVRELGEALAEERDALACRDPERVAATTGRKQRLADELDALGRDLVESLAHLGIGGGVDPGTALAARGHGALAAGWRDLAEGMSRCRDANLANGRVIAMKRRSTECLLDLLRGTGPGGRLYGRGGRSEARGHAGYIAKA